MAQPCVMLPLWVVVCFMFYSFIFVSNQKSTFCVVSCSNPQKKILPANQDFTFSKKALSPLGWGGFIWHLKCLGCCFCLFFVYLGLSGSIILTGSFVVVSL